MNVTTSFAAATTSFVTVTTSFVTVPTSQTCTLVTLKSSDHVTH